MVKSLVEEIEVIVKNISNNNPAPRKCTITGTYPGGQYADVNITGIGESIHNPLFGVAEIGDECLIVFMDGDLNKGAIITGKYDTGDITILYSLIAELSEKKADNVCASNTSNGLLSAEDKNKLDNIEEGANKITIDDVLSSDSVNPVQNTIITNALHEKADNILVSSSNNGLMSVTDKNKLDNIEEGANKTIIDATLNSNSINPVQNKTITTELNKKASLDTATSSNNGLMSSTDKTKLDTIENGATKTIIDSSLSSTSTNPVQNKAINAALNNKANSSHTHDDRYYTESEINTKLSSKSDTSHTHDDRYYTETEINNQINDLKSTIIKNSMRIRIGRWSDGEGENGTRIEVVYQSDGIYAQLSCDKTDFNYNNRTVVLFLNGVPYERTTDSTGKTSKLSINLEPGSYTLNAFVMGLEGLNPASDAKIINVVS